MPLSLAGVTGPASYPALTGPRYSTALFKPGANTLAPTGCAGGNCGAAADAKREAAKAAAASGAALPAVGGQAFMYGSGPVKAPYGARGPLPARGGELVPPGKVGFRWGFKVQGRGSRELPASYAPERQAPAREIRPLGPRQGLSNPTAPTTTRPLYLFGDLGQRWYEMNPVRPTVGDWLPVDGEARALPGGRPGGVPLARPQTLPQAEALLPMDRAAKQRLAAFNLMDRIAHFEAKPLVLLLSGPSPLQFAQAPRMKPGTPSGIVGVGVQSLNRPTRLRGTRAINDRAPRVVLERMARIAGSVNP